jgi:hypothetical protein
MLGLDWIGLDWSRAEQISSNGAWNALLDLIGLDGIGLFLEMWQI